MQLVEESLNLYLIERERENPFTYGSDMSREDYNVRPRIDGNEKYSPLHGNASEKMKWVFNGNDQIVNQGDTVNQLKNAASMEGMGGTVDGERVDPYTADRRLMGYRRGLSGIAQRACALAGYGAQNTQRFIRRLPGEYENWKCKRRRNKNMLGNVHGNGE